MKLRLKKRTKWLDPEGIPSFPGKPLLKNRARWLKEGGRVEIDTSDAMEETGRPLETDKPVTEPIDSFNLFLDQNEVIDEGFRKPTNRRAHLELGRPNPPKILLNWVDVTLVEMYKFVICLTFFPLSSVPCTRDFWSDGILGNAFIKSLFVRIRFEQIKHCFMVANPTVEENEADKLAKTRPFLELVKRISQKFWYPGRNQGLDESQALCGHRNSRISHRAATHKPKSGYVNIVAAHESNNGYCYSF